MTQLNATARSANVSGAQTTRSVKTIHTTKRATKAKAKGTTSPPGQIVTTTHAPATSTRSGDRSETDTGTTTTIPRIKIDDQGLGNNVQMPLDISPGGSSVD